MSYTDINWPMFHDDDQWVRFCNDIGPCLKWVQDCECDCQFCGIGDFRVPALSVGHVYLLDCPITEILPLVKAQPLRVLDKAISLPYPFLERNIFSVRL